MTITSSRSNDTRSTHSIAINNCGSSSRNKNHSDMVHSLLVVVVVVVVVIVIVVVVVVVAGVVVVPPHHQVSARGCILGYAYHDPWEP